MESYKIHMKCEHVELWECGYGSKSIDLDKNPWMRGRLKTHQDWFCVYFIGF